MSVFAAAAPLAAAPESAPWWLWLAYLGLFLAGLIASGLISGLETAIYSLSRLRLMVREGRGERPATILREEIADAQRMIATLLISNNVANFAVSFAITAILTRLLGWADAASIVAQALLLTPLLFLFGETIPKEIGRSRADMVAYPLAPLLRLIRRVYLCTGVLWFVLACGRWLSNRIGGNMTGAVLSARARIAALIEEGVGHGTLSPRQTDLVDRALTLRQMTVAERLISWPAVQTIRAEEDLPALRKRRSGLAYSRYPVIDSAGQVKGVADLIDLMAAPPGATAGDVCRAAPAVDASLDARSALAALRKAGADMAIVGTLAKPRGIVTLRGLLEPLISTEGIVSGAARG